MPCSSVLVQPSMALQVCLSWVQNPAGEPDASQDQGEGVSVAYGVSEADTMDVDLSECPVGAPAGAFPELPQVRLPPTHCHSCQVSVSCA